MTQAKSWTLAMVALVALVAGILLASGAVGFAQEGSETPTETPAATAAPTDDADGEDGDREGCPEKEQDDSADTTTSDA